MKKFLVEVLDRQVKKLHNKDVGSVKVLWRNQNMESAILEKESGMIKCYPYLFESTQS